MNRTIKVATLKVFHWFCSSDAAHNGGARLVEKRDGLATRVQATRATTMDAPRPTRPKRLPLTLEQRQAIGLARRAARIAAAQASEGPGWSLIGSHPHLAKATLPNRSALSGANKLSPSDAQAHRDALRAIGLRETPYPANGIVAIVSDVDDSNRARYNRYMYELVLWGGMDFGDSTWLTPEYIFEDDKLRAACGFGFFTPHFSKGHEEPAEIYLHTRTFNENVIEFHKGNVDHFHALLPNGPRVVVGSCPDRDGSSLHFTFDRFVPTGRNGCGNFFLLAICVYGKSKTKLDVLAVRVRLREGEILACRAEAATDVDNERPHQVFTISPDQGHVPPRVPKVRNVWVDFAKETDTAAVDHVVLLSASSNILDDCLKTLRDEYSIETPLITDHMGLHFRNEWAAAKWDERTAAMIRDDINKGASAVHGKVLDESGQELMTTEADDPASLFCVFPSFTKVFGGAYVVPAGGTAASQEGWDPLSAVTPSLTRANSGVYVAQRSMPLAWEGADRRLHSRAETFASRLDWMLKRIAKCPGRIWPVYTHLGRFSSSMMCDGLTAWEQSPPAPYFDCVPIRALQDAVFNVSGCVDHLERVWLVRATQAYDYAYLLRASPAHTKRLGPDHIAITSWIDEILDATMPRSPAQLYGLTFYVESPARSEVTLDGKPLALIRNPADASGRPSVTVAQAELRHIVFCLLDPARRSPPDFSVRGVWTWRDGEKPHGTLIPLDEGDARISIELHAWQPVGAQSFSFARARSAGSSMGAVVTTTSGGVFYFGDRACCPNFATATYFLDRHECEPDSWQTIVVPFNDLAWDQSARPGGPLPNQALKRIEIIARGGAVDLAEMVFLRPRATFLSRRAAHKYIVAGIVPNYTPQQLVMLREENSSHPPCQQQVDQRGAFCFSQVSTGIYSVSTEHGGQIFVDRRGPLVEVDSNIATLELGRDLQTCSAMI